MDIFRANWTYTAWGISTGTSTQSKATKLLDDGMGIQPTVWVNHEAIISPTTRVLDFITGANELGFHLAFLSTLQNRIN